MTPHPDTPRWFALYTRARFERRVERELQEKGLESYLPLHTVIRQWSDRKKKMQAPLFSCYVFVRLPLKQRMRAVAMDGVVRMVGFNGMPSPIPDSEIESIRRILDNDIPFEPVPYLPIGQRVEVMYGPFAGLRGRLIQYRGRKRLVVGIEQIKQSISVEIRPEALRVVDKLPAQQCHKQSSEF